MSDFPCCETKPYRDPVIGESCPCCYPKFHRDRSVPDSERIDVPERYRGATKVLYEVLEELCARPSTEGTEQ